MQQKNSHLVLIVDDSAEIRELFAFVVGDAGYRVTTAETGEEALARMHGERPDVMVTDMIMPGMGGLELLLKVRSDFVPPLPAVIACSGFTATAEEALRRGAIAFVAKPVSPDQLLATIVAAIGGPHPDAAMVSDERERVSAARQRAHRAAELTLARIDGKQLVRYSGVLVHWLSEYFECPTVLIVLLRPAGLQVLASTDPYYARDTCIDSKLSYATDIIETGSTLLLPDASAHPSFASYGEVARGARFFAGVPMHAEGVPIGAICFIDRHGRLFDAEELLLFEHLGRRCSIGLERLAAQRPLYHYSMASIPGLVREDSFALLLGVELRLGQRQAEAVEVAVVELADGASIADATAVVRRILPHNRLAIAANSRSRLAILKRGADAEETARQMSAALDGLRADVLAAGRVAIEAAGVAPLAQEVLLMATRALSRALTCDGGTERIVVRPEPSRDETIRGSFRS
jgi:CheY-like chemotaxis protein